MRLIDSCITQLKAQGPSRTCNESKEEEEKTILRSGDSADQGVLGSGGCFAKSVCLEFENHVFKAHRLCVSLNSRLESNKEEEEAFENVGDDSGMVTS